jgi:hypothetical protein
MVSDVDSTLPYGAPMAVEAQCITSGGADIFAMPISELTQARATQPENDL